MSMSAAAPTADAGAGAPKKGKKKLMIIVIVLLLVAVGGGAAFMMMKKKGGHDAEAAEEPVASAGQDSDRPDLKHPPTFLPLDPFVVNLADKDADRYAQIGITLEVSDAHFADEMKAFMPAIRNGVLMILAHKSSKELLTREGKEQLSGEILREASRTMGIEVEEPDDDEVAAPKKADDDETATKPKAKKKKRRRHVENNPIKHVHFSNFIVQ
jgi:flagellar FliL protein